MKPSSRSRQSNPRAKVPGLVVALLLVGSLSGCAPEVGSPAWCEKMDEKPKGDWSANEAVDYAEHCLLSS